MLNSWWLEDQLEEIYARRPVHFSCMIPLTCYDKRGKYKYGYHIVSFRNDLKEIVIHCLHISPNDAYTISNQKQQQINAFYASLKRILFGNRRTVIKWLFYLDVLKLKPRSEKFDFISEFHNFPSEVFSVPSFKTLDYTSEKGAKNRVGHIDFYPLSKKNLQWPLFNAIQLPESLRDTTFWFLRPSK